MTVNVAVAAAVLLAARTVAAPPCGEEGMLKLAVNVPEPVVVIVDGVVLTCVPLNVTVTVAAAG